jgi:hypothetical protein
MTFDCQLAFEKGLCNADCCGPVPIPKELWEKVKAEAKKPFKLLEIKGEVVPEPIEGLTCIFLQNKRCTIYNDRPEICRDYGINQWLPCPFLKANGHLRSFANHKRTQRQINHSVDDCLACIQRRALCQ